MKRIFTFFIASTNVLGLRPSVLAPRSLPCPYRLLAALAVSFTTTAFVSSDVTEGAERPRINDAIGLVDASKSEVMASESQYADSVDELFHALDEAVSAISPDSLEGDIASLLTLGRIVDLLLDKAYVVEYAHQGYAKNSREYQELLTNLLPRLKDAEMQYAAYVDEEAYPDLKEQYEWLADILKFEQERFRLRIETLAGSIDLVDENHNYIKSTVTFLQRCSTLLHSLEGLSNGQNMEQLIQNITRYVSGKSKPYLTPNPKSILH